MKAITSIILLLSSFNLLAASNLQNTDINQTVGPNADQLEKARTLLAEAIIALKGDKQSVYAKKLVEAKSYQNSRNIIVTKKAAFIAIKSNGKEVNYFGTDNEFFRYDIMIDETCYNGNIHTAKKLLDYFTTQTDYINYDEEWFDNPRVINGSLYIDFVDGPNEYKEERIISSCQ